MEVREYVSDYPSENLLLDREEFSDTFIALCMEMASEDYNSMSPMTSYTTANFPSKSLLLLGTCWKMYNGKMALLARNHLSYSDGGLQIPIEERYELYKSLADSYGAQYKETAGKLKISQNIDGGWDYVGGDDGLLPYW